MNKTEYLTWREETQLRARRDSRVSLLGGWGFFGLALMTGLGFESLYSFVFFVGCGLLASFWGILNEFRHRHERESAIQFVKQAVEAYRD